LNFPDRDYAAANRAAGFRRCYRGKIAVVNRFDLNMQVNSVEQWRWNPVNVGADYSFITRTFTERMSKKAAGAWW